MTKSFKVIKRALSRRGSDSLARRRFASPEDSASPGLLEQKCSPVLVTSTTSFPFTEVREPSSSTSRFRTFRVPRTLQARCFWYAHCSFVQY